MTTSKRLSDIESKHMLLFRKAYLKGYIEGLVKGRLGLVEDFLNYMGDAKQEYEAVVQGLTDIKEKGAQDES